mgnify:CR=1 FL=1
MNKEQVEVKTRPFQQSTVFSDGTCHDYQVRVREILSDRLHLKPRDVLRIVTSYIDPLFGPEDHNINFDLTIMVRKGAFFIGDFKHVDKKVTYYLGDFFIGQTQYAIWNGPEVNGKWYNPEIQEWVKL